MRKITDSTKFRQGVRNEIAKVLPQKHYASNLEKGIFNWSIREADNKNVVKKWENVYFVQIYVDRFRMIWVNLRNKDNNKELTCQMMPLSLVLFPYFLRISQVAK